MPLLTPEPACYGNLHDRTLLTLNTPTCRAPSSLPSSSPLPATSAPSPRSTCRSTPRARARTPGSWSFCCSRTVCPSKLASACRTAFRLPRCVPAPLLALACRSWPKSRRRSTSSTARSCKCWSPFSTSTPPPKCEV